MRAPQMYLVSLNSSSIINKSHYLESKKAELRIVCQALFAQYVVIR